ncbi:hypothetical protein LTR65_008697 [Meristemomyces frigidus]
MVARSNSGLAATVSADGSGRLFAYYQDLDGRIIENSYFGGSWTLEDRSKVNESVVTTNATAGSALAAVSYTLNSSIVRQLFFIDAYGMLRTTNSSMTPGTVALEWSTPVAVSSDIVSADSTVGLAACVDHNGMSGIRVYYGSSSGGIQEVGWQFDTDPGWTMWNFFNESDPTSGVACVTYDANDEREGYINVYMRNTTTGVVQQSYWDYSKSDGWRCG